MPRRKCHIFGWRRKKSEICNTLQIIVMVVKPTGVETGGHIVQYMQSFYSNHQASENYRFSMKESQIVYSLSRTPLWIEYLLLYIWIQFLFGENDYWQVVRKINIYLKKRTLFFSIQPKCKIINNLFQWIHTSGEATNWLKDTIILFYLFTHYS